MLAGPRELETFANSMRKPVKVRTPSKCTKEFAMDLSAVKPKVVPSSCIAEKSSHPHLLNSMR